MTTHIKDRKLPTTLASLTLICALLPIAGAQESPDNTPGYSRISGQVKRSEGNRPVVGAIIVAYHLSTGEIFRSEPTGGKGKFEIPNLRQGYYDLAVEAADGLFVGSAVVNLSPDGKTTILLSLTERDAPGSESPREFPGVDQPAAGSARIREKLTGKEFWKSPGGVAILSSLGGAALLALAIGSDDTIVSVSTP